MIAAIALVAASLTIVYPWPSAHLPNLARSFAFGAAPPGCAVAVNGIAAHSGRDGGWIAYVPLRPGRFTLHAVALAGRRACAARADRTIYVDEPLVAMPAAPAAIDAAVPPLPALNLVVRAGERIRLAVKASAYSRVTASIGHAVVDVPLTGDFRHGYYSADVRAPHASPAGALPVRYAVRSSDGSTASVAARGTISIDGSAAPRVGVIAPWRDSDGPQADGIVMRSPGAAYFLFPPLGTPFAIVGQSGDYYSVALGPRLRGYVYRKRLALLAAGTAPPAAYVAGVDVQTSARATRIVIRLTGRVPFRLVDDAAAASLDVRLFGASARAGPAFVRYGAGICGVRSVTWPAAPAGALDIRISLRQRTLWGYAAAWSGRDLAITVKRPPHLSSEPARAVSGLLVVVDPGHAPDSGAVGPLGTLERDVDLAIAKRLAAHLQALGARTLLTRTDAAGIGLYDRVALAARAGADVLISVHNNAWPDGVDPAAHHGYSVFYYRSQSRDLARELRSSYARASGLPDEGMYVDDLALARPTEQPSVLTESAFITWPDEEELLRAPAYQDRLGALLARGIEHWAEERRAREREQSPTRSAALGQGATRIPQRT